MGRTWLCVLLLTCACGGDEDNEPYDTYQECFDAHVKDDAMATHQEVIIDCCTKHEIADAKPACGADAPACINFLTDNLDQLSASTVEVMEACQMYEAQGAM